MDMTVESRLDLANALRLFGSSQNPPYKSLRLALTGGGGKSSALFQLARQLPPPVLLTASTHLAVSQLAQADRHFYIRSVAELKALEGQLFEGVTLVAGPDEGSPRTLGLSPEILEALHQMAGAQGVPLLVEADGSRRLPLKAPAAHEPAIPPFTNLAVSVVGLSGLGRPLCGAAVHRPEIFSDLSGVEMGAVIEPAAVIRVLLHPLGGLKRIPAQARQVVLLNQADDPGKVCLAAEMAQQLLAGYQAVVVASLGSQSPSVHAVHEKVAGIVLAGGGSSRLGKPKQLMEWQGIPLVRHVCLTAISAGLSPLLVVSGAVSDQVKAALEGMPVTFSHNPNWESGQASSVRSGVQALPADCGSAVFLLSDQPQVPVDLLKALVEAHARTLYPLVAPRVQGQRANPVLFDSVVFPELLKLRGDSGGRSLFSDPRRYPVEWVDWDDPNLLLDVDTPADYQRLLDMEAKP